MKLYAVLLVVWVSVALIFESCQEQQTDAPASGKNEEAAMVYRQPVEIPVPAGYRRVEAETGSFGHWLRSVSLKKNKTVYLSDGREKKNQNAQFAVLDIPVGNKDLQQCADAVMRLRAEYLFAQTKYDSIVFRDNNKKEYRWTGGNDRAGFERYLEMVFGWCGSASLEQQLHPVKNSNEVRPGDVFIHGGFPGHAMLVMDVAVNNEGEKIIMLSQSYMPAQDIHIVKNPRDEAMSPWYPVRDGFPVVTPEWKFNPGELRRW